MGASKSLQGVFINDDAGNPVAVILDGAVYRLQMQGKVLDAAGTQINPATQETLAAIDAKDFATESTLSAQATASNQTTIIGYVDGIEGLLTSLDGKDFATETTLVAQLNITLSALRDALAGAAPNTNTLFDLKGTLDTIDTVLDSLNAKDFATETTLATQLNITLAALRDSITGTAPNNSTLFDVTTLLTTIDGVLDSLNAKDFATETTLAAQLNITLSALRDAIAGASPNTNTLYDLEQTLESINAFLNAEDFASETTLAALRADFNAEDFASATNQTTIIGLITTIDAVLDAVYARQNDRSQRAIISSGAKGTAVAADLTSQPVSANIEGLHVVGAGIAGTPAGGVLSVQGVTGGEAIPVSQAAANATDIIVDELRNAGSPDLIVNGSVTAVNFDFAADPTDDILLSSLRLLCIVSTAFAFDGASFGAGPALANGVSITGIVNGGIAIDLGTITTNEGFIRFSNVREPLLSFDGANDIISSQFILSERVRLVAGSGDRIRLTVADDLSALVLRLSFFHAILYGVKQ